MDEAWQRLRRHAGFFLRNWRWLGGLYGVNVLLRLPGIFQERPPLTFCDEAAYTIDGAFKMYLDGSWVPTGFLAGGANYYPFVLVADFVTLVSGYEISADKFVLLSRFVGPVLAGAVMPLFVAAAVAQFTKRELTIVAGSLVATLSPLALGLSRHVYPDHLIVAPAAALLFVVIRIIQPRRSVWDYVAAGALVGLLISIKYSGVFLVLLIAMAHISGHRKGGLLTLFADKGPWLAGLVSLITFAALNPVGVANFNVILDALSFHDAHYNSGHIGLEAPNGHLFYSFILSLITFGVLGAILLAIGWIWLLRQQPRIGIPLLVFSLLFVFALGSYKVVINRNMMPVLPIMMIAMAVGFTVIVDTLREKWPGAGWVVPAIAVLFLAEPTWRNGASLANDFQADARSAAGIWIAENVPTGEPVGYQWGCWAIPFDATRNPHVSFSVPPTDEEAKACVNHLVLDEWQYLKTGRGISPWSHAVVSEHHFINPGQQPYDDARERQDRFLSDYVVIKKFSSRDYYGPGITVYRHRTSCPR